MNWQRSLVSPRQRQAFFTVDPWPVSLCNETFTRSVYAPITAFADPTLFPVVRAELQDCIVRSLSVLTDLH